MAGVVVVWLWCPWWLFEKSKIQFSDFMSIIFNNSLNSLVSAISVWSWNRWYLTFWEVHIFLLKKNYRLLINFLSLLFKVFWISCEDGGIKSLSSSAAWGFADVDCKAINPKSAMRATKIKLAMLTTLLANHRTRLKNVTMDFSLNTQKWRRENWN